MLLNFSPNWVKGSDAGGCDLRCSTFVPRSDVPAGRFRGSQGARMNISIDRGVDAVVLASLRCDLGRLRAASQGTLRCASMTDLEKPRSAST